MALSPKLPWELANPKWAAELNPVLANPMTNMKIISDVVLINGSTAINHGLQQVQQGWIIVDQQGAASIYRSQPLNSLTLTLTSSAAVTVSIGVF